MMNWLSREVWKEFENKTPFINYSNLIVIWLSSNTYKAFNSIKGVDVVNQNYLACNDVGSLFINRG
jgi:hypothetical protein